MDKITRQIELANEFVTRFGGEACVFRCGDLVAFGLKSGLKPGDVFLDVDGDECEVIAVLTS